MLVAVEIMCKEKIYQDKNHMDIARGRAYAQLGHCIQEIEKVYGSNSAQGDVIIFLVPILFSFLSHCAMV